MLIERVEDSALREILRRELEHLAAAHPAHRHGVVEVERPRVGGADARRLEAGLRVDEQLRLERHVQFVEDRVQIAADRVEGERRSTAPEPFVEPRYRI